MPADVLDILQRSRQGSRYAPAEFAYSLVEAKGINAGFLRPIRNAQSLPVVRKLDVSSGVARLLCWCCPAAISWLVALVVVDAIYRHSCRPFAHVGEERREVAPAVAHRDATSAISGIFDCQAPFFYPGPNLIGRSPSAAVNMPTHPAPAAFVAANQVRWLAEIGTTVTSAIPPQRSVGAMGDRLNKNHAKTLPGYVLHSLRESDRIVVSHLGLLCGSVVRAVAGPRTLRRLAYCSRWRIYAQ